jgi:hypothetical protein
MQQYALALIGFAGAVIGGAIAAWLGHKYSRISDKEAAIICAKSVLISTRNRLRTVEFNPDAADAHLESIQILAEPIFAVMARCELTSQTAIQEAWVNYHDIAFKKWKDDTVKADLLGAEDLYPSDAKSAILEALAALEASLN